MLKESGEVSEAIHLKLQSVDIYIVGCSFIKDITFVGGGHDSDGRIFLHFATRLNGITVGIEELYGAVDCRIDKQWSHIATGGISGDIHRPPFVGSDARIGIFGIIGRVFGAGEHCQTYPHHILRRISRARQREVEVVELTSIHTITAAVEAKDFGIF